MHIGAVHLQKHCIHVCCAATSLTCRHLHLLQDGAQRLTWRLNAGMWAAPRTAVPALLLGTVAVAAHSEPRNFKPARCWDAHSQLCNWPSSRDERRLGRGRRAQARCPARRVAEHG